MRRLGVSGLLASVIDWATKLQHASPQCCGVKPWHVDGGDYDTADEAVRFGGGR